MNDLISNTIQIETQTVSSKNCKNTYLIKRRIIGSEGKKAVMVMLYPTRCANNMSRDDSTFFHLTQHLPELGINEILVINLFSKVCNARMSTANVQVDENNMKFIEKEILSNKDFKDVDFIIAWGASMQSCKAATESKERLLKMYKKYSPKKAPQQLTCSNDRIKNETAPHPLFLGIRAKNSKWSLCDYKDIKQSKSGGKK